MEKFLVTLNAGKSLATCQNQSLFAMECSEMRCFVGQGSAPDPAVGAYSSPLAVGKRRGEDTGGEKRGGECKKINLVALMPSKKINGPRTKIVENQCFIFKISNTPKVNRHLTNETEKYFCSVF